MCLDVWRGHEHGGPYMHSIHFSYALGCFIGPVLAEPFISNSKNDFSHSDNDLLMPVANTTMKNGTYAEEESDDFQSKYNISGMKILYPTIGMFAIFTSLGYLAIGIKDLPKISITICETI